MAWWDFNDIDTYFTVATGSRYAYKPGEQIFLSYGRRSNKYLLKWYGFCIPDNKHDSIVIRIRRVIDNRTGKNAKTAQSIVDGLLLDEMDSRAELLTDSNTLETSQKSKKIALKLTTLHGTLMSYLRAHLLLTYKKPV